MPANVVAYRSRAWQRSFLAVVPAALSAAHTFLVLAPLVSFYCMNYVIFKILKTSKVR